jgi:hypothetical protein
MFLFVEWGSAFRFSIANAVNLNVGEELEVWGMTLRTLV